MSLDDLKSALEAFDEPTFCEGSVGLTERLAVMLPDGDVGALDDPQFVDWLLEHGEPAPFGQGGETKVDEQVRRAKRLRGVDVSGFDPAVVLGDVERVLSPRRHLVATLTDVLVYPAGGHFALHKDTPRSPDLVGTLIVGLPIEHTGGAFQIARTHAVDWSGAVDPTRLRWVAVFSDVDHEIKPVTSGARVTLVYSLTLSDRVRDDPTWKTRVAKLRAAAERFEMFEGGPLMIACTRHVIAPDAPQPQSVDALRGTDRDIADVLASCGFQVRVRTCLAAREKGYQEPDDANEFRRDAENYFARLDKPFVERDVDSFLDCITFEAQPWGDGGGWNDEDATSLAPYLVDTLHSDFWLIRKTAATTFMAAVEFSDDGYVGNNAYDAYLYKLAALEVTR